MFTYQPCLKKILVAFLLPLMLVACLPKQITKIDPTAFYVDTEPIMEIPIVCKLAYEKAIPKVAIVNFTNNTTFDYAKMVQESVQGAGQRTTTGGAGAGVGPGVAGIVWGEKEKAQFQKDSHKIEREVNAKLSESIEAGVTDEIINIGGVKVFTRSEMEKILREHKFQMSGLVDNNTLIKFGKLAGVKYIVTGSVDNVNLKWVSLESLRGGLSQYLGIIGTALAAGAETQEGWNIETETTIRILDVETGEIGFSKKIAGKEIIGKIPYPNYDALIGGIKKASSKGLSDARPELSKYFSVRGYILQTRTSPDGKERIAIINLGQRQGMKKGYRLIIYTFQEIRDPFTGKSDCDKVKLPVEAEVTDQIQEDKAWISISGDINQIRRVRAGALVERAQIEE
ncbi:MAG: CsgG/HfaB family protein [Nitrospirota bacterium]